MNGQPINRQTNKLINRNMKGLREREKKQISSWTEIKTDEWKENIQNLMDRGTEKKHIHRQE